MNATEGATIHEWFGLTYSNYLVLHRSIMQSMPEAWQRRFTAMLDEMRHAMGEEMRDRMPVSYDVRVLARETRFLQEYPQCWACDGEGETNDHDGHREDCLTCKGTGRDYDAHPDHRYETAEEVGFVTDPIPHYNRGRTTIDFQTGGEA